MVNWNCFCTCQYQRDGCQDDKTSKVNNYIKPMKNHTDNRKVYLASKRFCLCERLLKKNCIIIKIQPTPMLVKATNWMQDKDNWMRQQLSHILVLWNYRDYFTIKCFCCFNNHDQMENMWDPCLSTSTLSIQSKSAKKKANNQWKNRLRKK